MDIISNFLISMLANLSTPQVEKVILLLKNCKTPQEKIKAVDEAKGIIEVAVADGVISLDGALLDALKSIRCDHGTGQISINQTQLKARELLTGGLNKDSSGSTFISQSTLQSAGTKVSVGSGTFIKITGNATIHQY